MPRITHAAQAAEQPYSNVGKVLTFLAADPANDEQCALTGKELIIAKNVHGTTPFTVTITSSADEKGRTRDIATFNLVAGAIAIFGPFSQLNGWRQADGNLYFEASDASIEFAVVRLP
jgi:hypothetical protein